MNLNAFHFAEPLWLLGMIVIPVVFLIFYFFYRNDTSFHHLTALIDRHLLPYLVIQEKANKKTVWKTKLISWSIIWTCLMLAIAGPRFDYREIETMSKDQNLIILLDLSESMNAKDVAPSRMTSALQKIEDLIVESTGVKIGLIAFAADSHMITPITEDKEALRHMLPSIGTELIFAQGSRLTPAIKMAAKMIEADKNHHHDLVLISDGGFEDTSALNEVKKLSQNGAVLHVIGIGTVQGAVLQDSKGNIIKKSGSAIVSKLERGPLQEISKAGHGFYIEHGFTSFDETVILEKLKNQTEVINAGKKMRLWDEAFYFFLLPVIPLFLYKFRKGTVLIGMLFLFFPYFSLQANSFFMNSEKLGEEKFQNEAFEEAANHFQDPYRKGVAFYKAGNFSEAENLFKQCTREEVKLESTYNLGNALTRQQKFKEAIAAYEEVLKANPDHLPAKENLELVKQMQKQQSQNENQKDSQSEKDKDDSNDSQNSSEDKNAQNSKKSDQSSNDSNLDESEAQKDASKSDSENEDLENRPDMQEEQSENGANESKENKDTERELKSQEDQDADMWLNRLTDKPKDFLKNKFYIESKKNGTKGGIDPW